MNRRNRATSSMRPRPIKAWTAKPTATRSHEVASFPPLDLGLWRKIQLGFELQALERRLGVNAQCWTIPDGERFKLSGSAIVRTRVESFTKTRRDLFDREFRLIIRSNFKYADRIKLSRVACPWLQHNSRSSLEIAISLLAAS